MKLNPTGDRYSSPVVSTARWTKSQTNDIWFFVAVEPAVPAPLAAAATAKTTYDAAHKPAPMAILVICDGSFPFRRCRSHVLVTAGVSARISTGLIDWINSVGAPARSTHWSAKSAVVLPCCSYAHQKPALSAHTASMAPSLRRCLRTTLTRSKRSLRILPTGTGSASLWERGSRPAGIEPPPAEPTPRDPTAPPSAPSNLFLAAASPASIRRPKNAYVARHAAIPTAALTNPASYPSARCNIPAANGATAAPKLMPQ
mmetsp:Transcript_5897/g.24139  ORF Transcript_5897/g.24139 Transcript_5897/m.24139 type:complete len:258 (-) Transcript_5897:825-1598(-)